MKTCFKCHESKPLSEFYCHPMMGDGHLGKCKQCTKADVQGNYYRRLAHYRAYDSERFKKPERKSAALEAQRKMRRRDPQKWSARAKLHAAVRDGALTRPDACPRCGSTTKIEAHHDDYSKPLDVHWLCFICHRKEHGQLQDII